MLYWLPYWYTFTHTGADNKKNEEKKVIKNLFTVILPSYKMTSYYFVFLRHFYKAKQCMISALTKHCKKSKFIPQLLSNYKQAYNPYCKSRTDSVRRASKGNSLFKIVIYRLLYGREKKGEL